MDEQLLRELNENLKLLLTPVKKPGKTDEEKIKAYGDRVVASCAKRHLKESLKNK